MPFGKLNKLFVLGASIILAGCSGGPAADLFEGLFGVDSSGSGTLTTAAPPITSEKVRTSPLDLANVLDPDNRRAECVTRRFAAQSGEPDKHERTNVEIECAYQAFYRYRLSFDPKYKGVAAKDDEDSTLKDVILMLNRNRVQDRLVEISDEACTGFLGILNDQNTKTNYALGTAASATAILSSIFSDPATARGLAAASGIFSSARAERGEAYFQSQAITIVTKGIQLRREELLNEINGRRYGPPFVEGANEKIDLDRPKSDKDLGEVEESLLKAASSCFAEVGALEDTEEAKSKLDDCKDLMEGQEEAFRSYRSLRQIANAGRQKRTIRIASRPYIPLSPFDQVNIKLQEEFERDFLEQKQRLNTLRKQLGEKEQERSGINAGIARRKAQSNTRFGAARSDYIEASAAIAVLGQQKQAIDEKINTLNNEIQELLSGFGLGNGARGRHKTRELTDLQIRRDDIQSRIEAAKALQVNAAADLGLQVIPAAPLKGASAASADNVEATAPVDEAQSEDPEAEEPEASSQNEGNENNQVVVSVTEPGDADEERAIASGQLAALNLSPPTVSQTADEENELNRLAVEIESLERQIKTLEEAIEGKSDLFEGEVAKVDALVAHVPISQYNVEAAVADARKYHQACSILSGLEKAIESLDDEARGPTPEETGKGIDRYINLQEKLDTLRRKQAFPFNGQPDGGTAETVNSE